MNRDVIEGHWHEIKGNLTKQWGKLTDDDVMRMKGSYEELEGVLQKRYGYQKEEVKKVIEEFIDSFTWKDK